MLILPEHYDRTPVLQLLEEAERGRIGFDQRLIRSLLARPAETLDALEQFLARPSGENAVADLTDQIFDLYRALRSPQALPFYLDLLKGAAQGVPDELVEAFHELGEAAVEPLLRTYEEAPEEERPDMLFVLASLGVPHPRIRELVRQALAADPYEGASAPRSAATRSSCPRFAMRWPRCRRMTVSATNGKPCRKPWNRSNSRRRAKSRSRSTSCPSTPRKLPRCSTT